MSDFDAVIIGAGNGGLTRAGLTRKADCRSGKLLLAPGAKLRKSVVVQ